MSQHVQSFESKSSSLSLSTTSFLEESTMHVHTTSKLTAALAVAAMLMTATFAEAAFVSYHDLGATTGFSSTGNITTHQTGTGSTVVLDTSAKDLIRYSDGVDTGVDFSVSGANAMDARNGGETGPPAAATPADPLFNVAGLNLDNGTIYEGGGGSGATTFTLAGLDPTATYDVAFYGHRSASADGVERFTLGGADAATNSSSTGIVSMFVSDWETRPNAAAGDIVRWTDIDPGIDGSITITMDPEVSGGSNIAYVTALRLQEFDAPGAPTPEPSALLLAVLGLVGLAGTRRRRR